MTSKKVSVLGAGYWGKNLIRNFHELGALDTVYDVSAQNLEAIKKQFSGINVSTDFNAAFHDKSDGIVISTPAETHFDLAKSALNAGKDVFVEKPLSLNHLHAQELVDLSKEKTRILMVGHLLQYHPAVVKLKTLIQEGSLGKIEYLYSNRVNLGKIRREENILWSFAPHDISVMLWLIGHMPIQVNVTGGNFLQPNIADSTVSSFMFEGGVRAHIYVSWLHPFKEQRMVVIGSNKMAVFDDRLPAGQKLTIYNKTINLIDGQFVPEKTEAVIVEYDTKTEPLKAECQHFLDSIAERTSPRTNGEEGLRVLKVLQSCQRSLEMNGQPVQVV
jgi:UDP-2-acetamido-3-amino-2,3-dideoxy-glucuronate N-acetyltransferase